MLLAVAITGVLSCKNNDNVFPTKNPDSGFRIVNASPNTINYFLNGTRLNNSGGLASGVATSYINVTAGQQNFQFKLDGSPDILFGWPEKMPDSVGYTLYITGNTADKAFRVQDVFAVDTGFAALGFVNASAAGDIDVAVGDTMRFKKASFKAQTEFKGISTGERDVKFYKAGTTTLLKDTTFTMSLNRVYTIYSYGTPGAKGSSQFGVAITTNL